MGYRRAFYEVAALAENLFNTTWREAQFEESSRLRHETPCAVGSDSCHNDIKFTAGTPFTATLRLTFFWR